ncbi:MAG: LuxR C-terminal-related transcriptional regulator [Raoultibacter sp.]
MVGTFAGLGAGALIPLWFEQAGSFVKNHYAYVLGFMSLLGGLIVLFTNAVPLVFSLGLCIVLLSVSLGLLWPLNSRDISGESESAQVSEVASTHAQEKAKQSALEIGQGEVEQGWLTLMPPLIYVFLLSVIYGALTVVTHGGPTFSVTEAGLITQAASVVTIAIFVLYVYFEGRHYSTLLNVVLGITATGLLFLPFLSDAYSFALIVLTHIGWEIALLVSYALVIKLYKGNRFALIGCSAIVFAFPRPGLVAGLGVASLITVDNQPAFVQTTIIVFALLYLVLMGTWLLRTREKRAAERALRKRDELIARYSRARNDMYQLVCEDLAAAHKLTPREGEVLFLLAQGRDAAYIGGATYLSLNTVKSYRKSIYAKLGVHSKQELINAVEAKIPSP